MENTNKSKITKEEYSKYSAISSPIECENFWDKLELWCLCIYGTITGKIYEIISKIKNRYWQP